MRLTPRDGGGWRCGPPKLYRQSCYVTSIIVCFATVLPTFTALERLNRKCFNHVTCDLHVSNITMHSAVQGKNAMAVLTNA